MKNKKIIYQVGILMGILILLTTNILAFAVSSKYYEDYPIYLSAGETQEVQMTLQNLASTEDVNVRASIREGDGIIEITDASKDYLIPTGEKTIVNLKITIPSDAEIQEAYAIKIQFTTVTVSESGTAGLASGISKEFNVIVGTPAAISEKKLKWLVFKKVLISLIGILVIIILIIWKVKKRKTSGKKRAKQKKK